MKTVEQTLEQLDNALDTVEELVRELPISDKAKRELSDQVYTFWMDVEEAMVNEQKEVDSTLI
jgi:uncharacterized protein YacL (UPF0231 family)